MTYAHDPDAVLAGRAPTTASPEAPPARAPGRGSLTARLPRSAAAIARDVVRVMRAGAGAVAADADAAVAAGTAGGGAPLPTPLRQQFEGSLGVDLAAVRVHADGAAATAAASVGARAFAVGDAVVMGAGAYQPDTAAGRWLLAHEVAHTVQQRGGASLQAKLAVTSPGDHAEVEADRAADAMVAGHAATVTAAPPALARFPPDAGMDAHVEPPRDPPYVAPPDAATSRQPCAHDWYADARRRAATIGDPPRPPATGALFDRSPLDPTAHAQQAQLEAIQRATIDALTAANQRLTEYLRLPLDPLIAGGHQRHLHDVVDANGQAQGVDARTAARIHGAPGFMAAAGDLRAAAAAVAAARSHSLAVSRRNLAAQQRVQQASAALYRAQAQREQQAAADRRDAATTGRQDELAGIQNAIRVLELAIGLLAGGVAAGGAAGAAAESAVAAPTVGARAQTAATNAVAGIGSNSLHDLAVGALAEQFVNERWSNQIATANGEIERFGRAALDAGVGASTAELRAAIHEAAATAHDADEAAARLLAACQTYTAAHAHSAQAASTAAPGRAGQQAAAGISAIPLIQRRLTALDEVAAAATPPTEAEAHATAIAFAAALASRGATAGFIDNVACLLALRDRVVPRERAHWRRRLDALTGQLDELGRAE